MPGDFTYLRYNHDWEQIGDGHIFKRKAQVGVLKQAGMIKQKLARMGLAGDNYMLACTVALWQLHRGTNRHPVLIGPKLKKDNDKQV
jgi:hypothetical protein